MSRDDNYREQDYFIASRSSRYNRESLSKADTCGCFHCKKIFKTSEIKEWVDKDWDGVYQTALCPYCGIDTVVGNNSEISLTMDLLERMYAFWFVENKRDIIRDNKKATYCYILMWVFIDIRYYAFTAMRSKWQFLNPLFYLKCYKRLNHIGVLADMFHFIPEIIGRDFDPFDEEEFWAHVKWGYSDVYKKKVLRDYYALSKEKQRL